MPQLYENWVGKCLFCLADATPLTDTLVFRISYHTFVFRTCHVYVMVRYGDANESISIKVLYKNSPIGQIQHYKKASMKILPCIIGLYLFAENHFAEIPYRRKNKSPIDNFAERLFRRMYNLAEKSPKKISQRASKLISHE